MNWTKGHIDSLTGRIGSFEQRAASLEQSEGDLSRRTADLEQSEGSIREATASLEQRLRTLQQRVDDLETQNDDLLAAIARRNLVQKPSFGLTENEKPVPTSPEESTAGDAEESVYTVLDYFKFENHFRGPRSVIRERQGIYLPYFRDQAGPVLDLGCGRGEFLQVMKQNNIPAFGIDLYPEYVEEGKLLDIDIRQGDGIAWLRESQEQYGGIYVGQVIEHISFQQLQELCSLAFEKLLPDSWLILETPNPMCLSVFANSFYIDPTHNRLVHPLTLKYLLEEIGFHSVDILFTECSRMDPLPLIKSDEIININEVNAGIRRVSDLLFGSQDYAVVARR